MTRWHSILAIWAVSVSCTSSASASPADAMEFGARGCLLLMQGAANANGEFERAGWSKRKLMTGPELAPTGYSKDNVDVLLMVGATKATGERAGHRFVSCHAATFAKNLNEARALMAAANKAVTLPAMQPEGFAGRVNGYSGVISSSTSTERQDVLVAAEFSGYNKVDQ